MDRRRLDNNAIVSITATIVSVCALFIATYQTILMRQQQSATVWPKLVFSNGWLGEGDFYTLEVKNVGVGPALIKRVVIRSGQQSFSDLGKYNNWLTAGTKTSFNPSDSAITYFDYSDISPEDAIPANAERKLITVKGNPLAQLFVKNLPNFYLQVDYESLYGEAWTAYYPAWRTPKK